MPRSDPQAIVASLRRSTSVCKKGGPDSFKAFYSVVTRLLHLTVMREDGHLTLAELADGGKARAQRLIRGSHGPIPLRDGNFLRLSISLYIEGADEGSRLKTWQSAFQYQHDREGKDWIFRYDYLRSPEGSFPPAHVQICGKYERVHFPTMRVPLEAIIRCLANDFNVPCSESAEVWRYVLHHTEIDFLEIHHPPVSCPAPPPAKKK